LPSQAWLATALIAVGLPAGLRLIGLHGSSRQGRAGDIAPPHLHASAGTSRYGGHRRTLETPAILVRALERATAQSWIASCPGPVIS
jgi:hypothetical protein